MICQYKAPYNCIGLYTLYVDNVSSIVVQFTCCFTYYYVIKHYYILLKCNSYVYFVLFGYVSLFTDLHACLVGYLSNNYLSVRARNLTVRDDLQPDHVTEKVCRQIGRNHESTLPQRSNHEDKHCSRVEWSIVSNAA